MENIKYETRHLKTISLFSGAGGKDLGFLNAGFDIIWANDINKEATKSYEANIGNHILCGDLNDYLDTIPNHEVLLAGFPCQPFSMMGSQKGFDDERGTLFFTIQKILKKHDTKIIVLENVRNLLSHDSGKTFSKMKTILEDLGYDIHYKVLNTADYGLPQTRRRLFVVGFNKKYYSNIKFNFPKEMELKITLQDLLDEEVDKKYYLSEKILKTILASGTKNYSAKSEIDLKIARPLTATMHKMHRASQDNYVTDLKNRVKFENHEKQISNIRKLTPNECRKLQGFPSTWKQVGSDTQAYIQFGNAVTVDLAYYLAKEVYNSVKNHLEINVEKKSYSLFPSSYENIDTILKKDIIEAIIVLKKSLIEIYDLDLIATQIDRNKIIEFFKRTGIINCEEDILNLKSILGKEYKEFENVVSNFLKLDILEEDYDKNILRFLDFYRMKKLKEALASDRPTLVDFFCGSGGLSLGFKHEGFRSILANDIEDVCIKTYSFNHLEIKRENCIVGDIKEVVEGVENYINDEVDIIVGGPPCQSFSTANRQRIIDDPRNVLYKYYVKAVEKLKPKFFVMENVKGMLEVANQVVDDFHNLESVNYNVSYQVFNAFDFSVPQNRERLIYIGVRDDMSISPKDILEEICILRDRCETFVLGDAIKDLKELDPFRLKNSTELDTEESGKKVEKNRVKETNGYINLINLNKISSLIYNHKTRYNNDRDIEIFGRMLPGDKSDSPRIADIMPYQNRKDIFKDKYHKLEFDKRCKAITAHMKFDCNMYIHPTQARGLTPREAARVQSYPDEYLFLGPYTKTYMQIGNSVPPLMSNIFAKVIKKYLK
ncbi:DNA cytosine methyltransferase [Cetobacterium sp.]|uniref:DNA cytosine methyltransferase n=1 Tax=Cetobacterium sp. TaxID=2071632 RepID=UPI003F3C6350